MREDTNLYQKKVNIGALSVWLLGGIAAFVIVIVFGDRGNIGFTFQSIVPNFKVYFFFFIYLSLPFLVLGILIKIRFRNKDLPRPLTFKRVLQIICASVLIAHFYYAYAIYLKSHGNMFDVLTGLSIIAPIIALFPLLLGFLIGVLLGDGIIFFFPNCFAKK